MLTVGSLFAGVGGICTAFRQAQCDVIWANEFDRKARETYILNNPDSTNLYEYDVREINKKDKLPEVDIITAGFPCQPFSLAGFRGGFNDPRGKLFHEVTRLLDELQPRAYFLENVKMLANHDNGNSFKKVKDAIIKANYSFIPFILNAAEYTGIPQGRERIYIVGFRNEPEHFYNAPILENNLKNIPPCPMSEAFKIPSKFRGTIKSFCEFLEENVSDEFYYSDNSTIHNRIKESVKRRDTVYQYRRFYVRENKSKVCPTLTASMGGGGHNVPLVLEKNKQTPRKLTPKECFNLQGFSKKQFKLPSGIANSQLYKQAGNAVVVPMVEKIACEITKVLRTKPARK